MTRVRSAAWLARTRGRFEPSGLRILFYHRVCDDRDELAVTPRRFREQMDYLASEGYGVVNILEAVRLLRGGTIPPRTVGLNFDDGFLDVAENALAVLAERGFRATVFVSTGVTDRRFTFPWCTGRPRLLSWDEIVDSTGKARWSSRPTRFAPQPAAPRRRPRAGRDPGSKAELEERLDGGSRPSRIRRACSGSATPARRRGRVRDRRLCEPGVNHPDTDRLALAAGRSTPATACSTSAPRSEAATTRHCRSAVPTDAFVTARVRPSPGRRARGGRRRGAPAETPPGRNARERARGPSPQPAPKSRIDEEALEGGREAHWIVRRNEQARLAVLDRLRHAADRRRNDRERGAIASRIESGSPSEVLESTKTSARARRPPTSGRSPARATVRSRPSRRTAASTRGRSGPSPTITAVKPVRSLPSACTSVNGSLGRCRRPTATTLGSAPSARWPAPRGRRRRS